MNVRVEELDGVDEVTITQLEEARGTTHATDSSFNDNPGVVR